MIKKWYAFYCDYCGNILNYRNENTIKEAIEKEKKSYTRVIAFYNKKCFCNEDCYKEYEHENRFYDITKKMD